MKIEISTVIDIPEEFLIPEARLGSAIQILFDDVVNYATVAHLRDATHWLAKSKEDKKSSAYRIFKHHETWGKLLAKQEWDYKEVE